MTKDFVTQARAGDGQLSPGREKSKPFSLQGSQLGALELQGSVGRSSFPWLGVRADAGSRRAGGCGVTCLRGLCTAKATPTHGHQPLLLLLPARQIHQRKPSPDPGGQSSLCRSGTRLWKSSPATLHPRRDPSPRTGPGSREQSSAHPRAASSRGHGSTSLPTGIWVGPRSFWDHPELCCCPEIRVGREQSVPVGREPAACTCPVLPLRQGGAPGSLSLQLGAVSQPGREGKAWRLINNRGGRGWAVNGEGGARPSPAQPHH